MTSCCRATADGGLKANGCATTAVGLSSLEVRMTGPEQVAVGGEAFFEITIINRGQTPAANLLITDRLDPGLEHKKARGQILERDLGELAAGQSQRIGVTLQVTAPGRLCHTVEITGPTVAPAGARACVTAVAAGPVPGPSDVAPPPGGQRRPAPALLVKITGPEKHLVGEIAKFTIDLTNTGALPLSNLKVINSWDPVLRPKEASGGHRIENSALTWSIDNLPAGQSIPLTILCECRAASARACNRVSVVLPDGGRVEDETCLEILPAKETPPTTPEITPPAGGELQLSAVGLRNPVAAGNELTYEIRATNNGSISYRQISVTAIVPEGMAPNPLGTAPPAKFTIDGQVVRFNPIDELQPGQSQTYRVRVRTLRPGRYRFRAELTAPALPQPLTHEAEKTEVFLREE